MTRNMGSGTRHVSGPVCFIDSHQDLESSRLVAEARDRRPRDICVAEPWYSGNGCFSHVGFVKTFEIRTSVDNAFFDGVRTIFDNIEDATATRNNSISNHGYYVQDTCRDLLQLFTIGVDQSTDDTEHQHCSDGVPKVRRR